MKGSRAWVAAGLLVTGLLFAFQPAGAADLDAETGELVALLDAARFAAPRWERSAALRDVATRAGALTARYPEAAGPLTVRGGALTALAIGLGGTRGADDAREARALLKEALARNPAVLDGAAHTWLALLYHRMPGAPFGVGSARRAERQFRQALAINPRSGEANFLYAEFLADEDRPDEAIPYAEAALAAADAPAPPLADIALAGDARELLAQLRPGDR